MNLEEENKKFKEVSELIRDTEDKALRGEQLVETSISFSKVMEELKAKNAELENVKERLNNTMSVNDKLYSQISDNLIPTATTKEEELVEKINKRKVTYSDFKDLL